MKKENIRYIVIIAVVLIVAMNYDKIMSMLRKGVKATSTNGKPPTVAQAQASGAGVGTLAVDSRGDMVSMAR
jgi:hypothetical protein